VKGKKRAQVGKSRTKLFEEKKRLRKTRRGNLQNKNNRTKKKKRGTNPGEILEKKNKKKNSHPREKWGWGGAAPSKRTPKGVGRQEKEKRRGKPGRKSSKGGGGDEGREK